MQKLFREMKAIFITLLLVLPLMSNPTDINGTLTGVANDVTLTHRGPGGGGSMFAIAIHPTDKNNIFFSNDMGVVSHSLDGGQTWTMVPGLYQIRFMEFDKNNPNTVWAGGGSGLYKSTDGGAHWSYSFNITTGNINATLGAIAIDPTDSNIMYAAEGFVSRMKITWVRGRVWKSTDGGATWRKLARPGGELGDDPNYNRNYSTIIIDPNSPIIAGEGHSDVYLVGQVYI